MIFTLLFCAVVLLILHRPFRNHRNNLRAQVSPDSAPVRTTRVFPVFGTPAVGANQTSEE